MKRYTVSVSPSAADRIADYGAFIAEQSASQTIAQRWVDQVYKTIETLDQIPRRFALAEEDPHVDCEVRRLLVGNYLACYTIDDEAKTVRVIGFRHGRRLPRPDELG